MELSVRHIVKSFGEKRVLEDVCFTVRAGSALGLLGRNGAGKTTTIRIIMGVFPPDSGEVMVDGRRISKTDVRFGYLPEERGLYPKQKIIDQMIYIGMLRGLTRYDAKRSAQFWLRRLDMDGHANDKLMTLSKGNQQKIQLAVTLVSNPDIVILDEPFSGLDPVNARVLKDVVVDLMQENKIVLFSSHQMGYVEEFCDDIVILNDGCVVLEGNLKQIKRQYDRTNIDVRLDCDDTAEVLRRMQADGAFDGFVKGIDAADEGAIVRLRSERDRQSLIAALAGAGKPVERIGVREPSLEDIFVEKAGDLE